MPRESAGDDRRDSCVGAVAGRLRRRVPLNQRPDAAVGEHFEQHRVRHAPIDDVSAADTGVNCIERAADLRQHPA